MILTIENCTAVLGGRGQRFARRVQLVAVVSDANFELNGFSGFLEHTGTVEDRTQRVLSFSLVFLLTKKRMLNRKRDELFSFFDMEKNMLHHITCD